MHSHQPEYKWGQGAETMCLPDPDEERAVKTVLLHNDNPVKREAICWARERVAEVGTGVWMRSTHRSQSDDYRVGAAVLHKHRDSWRAFCYQLGTEYSEVTYAELWAIGLTLREWITKMDTLQTHRQTTVARFIDSLAAIQQTEHLTHVQGQRSARWRNQCPRTPHKASTKSEMRLC